MGVIRVASQSIRAQVKAWRESVLLRQGFGGFRIGEKATTDRLHRLIVRITREDKVKKTQAKAFAYQRNKIFPDHFVFGIFLWFLWLGFKRPDSERSGRFAQ